MKRLVSVFIALIICCTFIAACKSDNEYSTNIVGKWEYDNKSYVKDYITDIIDEDVFYKVYYEFEEDGSGCTYIEGYEDNPTSFTYEFDPDDKILSYTFENGNHVEVSCEVRDDVMRVVEGENEAYFQRIG